MISACVWECVCLPSSVLLSLLAHSHGGIHGKHLKCFHLWPKYRHFTGTVHSRLFCYVSLSFLLLLPSKGNGNKEVEAMAFHKLVNFFLCCFFLGVFFLLCEQQVVISLFVLWSCGLLLWPAFYIAPGYRIANHFVWCPK